MIKIILAILLFVYSPAVFCFEIEWNKVDSIFSKVDDKDLDDYIYSIWEQNEYFTPDDLDVYNIHCPIAETNVFLYREPVGVSHAVGYFILKDSSGYHDLSVFEILKYILNCKTDKFINSKLIFLSNLASVVDPNGIICVNKNELSYVYSRHGMASLMSRNIAQDNSLRVSDEIAQWIIDNFGIRIEYTQIKIYSRKNNKVSLIKTSYDKRDGYCLYSKIKSNTYFYKIDEGFIDSVMLIYADNIINQSRMSSRQKIIIIKNTYEALLNLYYSNPDLR